LRFAKSGTLRSRFITASLSVICAMVVKIYPGIDAQAPMAIEPSPTAEATRLIEP
jgi:hypothetical protein